MPRLTAGSKPPLDAAQLPAENVRPLTVLVAGFPTAVGAGLRHVIESDGQLRVCDIGMFNLRGVIAKQRPNAILLDAAALSDVMELRRLVATHPATGVVVGVADLNRERDHTLLAAGARMVVPLTWEESDLRVALRLVASELVGPPRLVNLSATAALALLTDRETQVFELLIRRHTAREIADVLHVAVATVNAHTRRIYDKLGVHSRSELGDLAAADLSPRNGAQDPSPEPRLSRDRVPFGRLPSAVLNGERPSVLDMCAAIGSARWTRQG